jgi:hypothetical protein
VPKEDVVVCFKVLSLLPPGRTLEIHRSPQLEYSCPRRDSIQAPLGFKSQALPPKLTDRLGVGMMSGLEVFSTCFCSSIFPSHFSFILYISFFLSSLHFFVSFCPYFFVFLFCSISLIFLHFDLLLFLLLFLDLFFAFYLSPSFILGSNYFHFSPCCFIVISFLSLQLHFGLTLLIFIYLIFLLEYFLFFTNSRRSNTALINVDLIKTNS